MEDLGNAELLACAQRERDQFTLAPRPDHRRGPVSGFVLPTLRRSGLLSRCVAGRFHEVLQENLGSQVVGNSVEEFTRWIPDLPEDTAAWLLASSSSRLDHSTNICAPEQHPCLFKTPGFGSLAGGAPSVQL